MKFAASRVVLATLSRAGAREFSHAGGLEVTLRADSPLFHKPANIDVDHCGRTWVAETKTESRRHEIRRGRDMQ